MNKPLKAIYNQYRGNSISDIIGRDASPKLLLTPPEFDYKPVNMYNRGIKWFTSLIRFDKGAAL